MKIRNEIKFKFSLDLFVYVFVVLVVYAIESNHAHSVVNEPNAVSESSRDSFAVSSHSNCCEDTMIIDSALYPEGYLKAPPLYEELNESKNSKKSIDCVYKFYGKPGERIQLFYEDFDLYYPYDIYKFNKIDCRYSDSICLKFYDTENTLEKQNKDVAKQESISLENHNYDLCNCINISYTPRQIISASNFIQVRFKTVKRSFDTSLASIHSKKAYRGYILRYQFTKTFGLDNKEGGELDKSGECKVYFYSKNRRDGYFSSPNYPGLYPRDIECHYYFIGQKNEKVQVTFHTFDVEGVEQCRADTKSDYVELSNFQNRDRFYSRFCGMNKPGAIISDGSFFHVTFYSNNVFDGKGFQASYYFIDSFTENGQKDAQIVDQNSGAAAASSSVDSSNQSGAFKTVQSNFNLIFILFNILFLIFSF